jgi:hypothetical protein
MYHCTAALGAVRYGLETSSTYSPSHADTWKTINLGQTATNPDSYFKNLTEVGIALKPEWVIMAIFMGNDFMQTPMVYDYTINETLQFLLEAADLHGYSLDYLKAYLTQRRFRHNKPVIIPRSVVEPIGIQPNYWELFFKKPINHEFFVKKMRIDQVTFEEICKPIDSEYVINSYKGLYNPTFLLEALKHQLDKKNKRTNFSPYYTKQDRHNVIGILKELKKILNVRKIRLLVLVIPDVYQVHNDLFQSHLKTLGYESPPSRLLELHDLRIQLVDFLKMDGFLFADLTDYLISSGQLCYHIKDTHFNANGHQLTAQKIFEIMTQQELTSNQL